MSGHDVRLALSDHAMTPLSPTELRTLAGEMEDVLITHECQFSHPDWRYVDGLRVLATRLESHPFPHSPHSDTLRKP